MLSKEQFNNLRKQGLSIDQIVKFDKGEVPSVTRRPAGQRGFKEGWATAGWKGIKEGYKAAAVGAVSTLTKLSSFGERMLHKPSELFGVEPLKKTAAEELVPEKFRKLPEDASPAAKAGLVIEQAAEWFIPITKATKLAQLGKAGKVLEVGRRILDPTAKTALQSDKLGTEEFATGAIIGAGGVLTHYGAKAFQYAPQWLMQKAIGQKAGDYLAGKDVSKFALDKKKMGSVDQLIKKGKVEIAKELERINRKFGITGKKNEVTAGSIRKSYYKLLDFLKKEKEEVSLEDLLSAKNNIRTSIKEIAKEKDVTISKFDLESLIPRYKNVLQETALREALKIKSAAGKGDQILTFANLAPLILGASTGLGFGGIPGVTTTALGYAARSTAVLSTLGVTTEMLKKAAPVLQKLTPFERGILSQIIQQITK